MSAHRRAVQPRNKPISASFSIKRWPQAPEVLWSSSQGSCQMDLRNEEIQVRPIYF